MPFAVRLGVEAVDETDIAAIRQIYQLPEKFFFLPNQMWKHKNHLGVIAALEKIQSENGDVIVIASGNPSDLRHPSHPQDVLNRIVKCGLQSRFIFLGMIPYRHILPLMRISAGVVNPSFCEGWSTTVEEAKALGVPLILSDLAIHREQTDDAATFFNPNDPADIAHVLQKEWARLTPGPRPEIESRAKVLHAQRRKEFAMTFSSIAHRTIAAYK
jgi:glycosyltransferase involved in cell wall biosynthesis